MRILNTVYVRNHRARISHRRGALIVKSPDGSWRVPLEAVDALVIIGGAQITTQALDACVTRRVRVAALRANGGIRFVVTGPVGGNVHLRLAQYQAATDAARALALSRVIVAGKLQNSRKVVDRWARDEKDPAQARWLADRAAQIRERIARLGAADTADRVRGIEGDAARLYFGTVGRILDSGEFRFSTRTRRPPRDPVNAMLGFAYAMLLTECIGAAQAAGLDHQIGFLHRPRAGRPSLALDLAEEFRALTDRFVVAQVRRGQVDRAGFVTTPGGGVYLNDKGRERLIIAWEDHKDRELRHTLLGRDIGRWALPAVQATLLARHLRGDLPTYPPFVLI
ncbi:MAG: CRISPR-associated endonuclease Cas1 [Rhodobacteraceae bacterium]|nr:CRISPR-associated endonuclease Cas1 [Paracoccaceae bacterium]